MIGINVGERLKSVYRKIYLGSSVMHNTQDMHANGRSDQYKSRCFESRIEGNK